MCRRRHNLDNGACFIDAGLRRACAVLGIRLTHSQPGRPAGRGKIERFFKTVRDQFLVEISGDPDDPNSAGSSVASLAELNSLFTAWVEQVYHQRVHTETDMPPLARFLAAGPPVPTPAALLAEAFRWGEWRTVTKTDLRHTCASVWLGAGADPKVVQRILGHASAAMTMDLYGHLIDQNLWDAAERVGGITGASGEVAGEKEEPQGTTGGV